MTLTQAAAYLQITKAHLSNVINRKVADVPPLRCFRVGRRILIKREWVDSWMEATNLKAIQ
jgi:excisionase family DNA binding protein